MLAPLLLLALTPSSEGNTGNTLFHQCQATVRIYDGEKHSDDPLELSNASECIGYLFGIYDGQQLGGKPKACAGDATLETFVRLYVRFMQSNPKLLDLPRAAGALLAFQDAYPCEPKR